jgi:hypothetical protein
MGYCCPAMGANREADGSSETTERLLEQSRELLDDLRQRLGDEEGSVRVDPQPEAQAGG